MTGEHPTVGSSPDPLIGTVLAERYRIEKRLGEGGMGTVYLARHVMLEKIVALKILHDEYARRRELVERFLHEAKAASRIRHEHVIDITDFGETASKNVFFAMEYLEGHDLASELDRVGTLPWPRIKKIILQICSALQAAHEAGVIHRDLKPENIYLIEKFGQTEFVKVLDFGVAKLTEFEDKTRRLTRTGMVFGTPEYMSPEQARGDKPDNRVDVYACGCILFEMVTGQVPFTGDSFMGVLTKHLLEPIPRVADRVQRSDLPPGLQEVVDEALSKNRDERFASMNELAVAVDTLDNVEGISYRAPGASVGAATSDRARVSSPHPPQLAVVPPPALVLAPAIAAEPRVTPPPVRPISVPPEPPPPTPADMGLVFDDEDAEPRRGSKRGQWILVGGGLVASVAALMIFLGTHRGPKATPAAAVDNASAPPAEPEPAPAPVVAPPPPAAEPVKAAVMPADAAPVAQAPAMPAPSAAVVPEPAPPPPVTKPEPPPSPPAKVALPTPAPERDRKSERRHASRPAAQVLPPPPDTFPPAVALPKPPVVVTPAPPLEAAKPAETKTDLKPVDLPTRTEKKPPKIPPPPPPKNDLKNPFD